MELAGRHTAGSVAIQIKLIHFNKGFLSVITTGAHGFLPFKTAAGHQDNLTAAREGLGSFSQ